MVLIVSVTQDKGRGAEAVLLHLLDAWSLDKSLLTLLCPPSSLVAQTASALGYHVIPLRSGRDSAALNLLAATQMIGKMRQSKLIHAWTSRAVDTAWCIGRMIGVPVTATMHDSPFASFHRKRRQRLMKFFVNRLSELVIVSESLRLQCSTAAFNLPIRVIHSGLNDPCPVKDRRKGNIVGFVGMGSSVKGFNVVKNWIAQTQDDDVQWRLYGHLAASQRSDVELVKELGGSKVKLMGNVKSEEIFNEIDVLVHPSVEFDALPTALIEAARAGIPSVASDVGGTREVVEEGVTGFLFHPAEEEKGLLCLRNLIDNPELRHNMGNAARKSYLKLFTAQRMMQEYLEFWGSFVPSIVRQSQ